MEVVRLFAFADEPGHVIAGQHSAIKRNGLIGMKIRGVEGENVSVLSVAKAREVHAKLSDAGISVWSAGLLIGKIDIKKDNYPRHLDLLCHTPQIAQHRMSLSSATVHGRKH